MDVESTTDPTPWPSWSTVRGPWGMLAGAWTMFLFVGAYAITPSSLLPVVMADFGIQEAAAAWIITMPQVAATVVGLPIGMYLDRVDNRLAIAFATGTLLVAGLGGWLAGSATAYWWLLATRLAGGVALFILWTASTNLLSDAFPAGSQGTAVSLFTTGYPMGYAFGQVAGPALNTVVPWSSIFAIYSVLTAGAFGVFWLTGEDVVEGSAGDAASTPTLSDFGQVLTNRGVWGVCTLSLLMYTLYMIFNGWMPTYVADTLSVSLTRAGAYTALFPAIGLAARPMGGVLSDRLFDRRRRPVLLVGFGATAALVAATAFGTSAVALVGGLVATGFVLQLPLGLLYAYVQDFVDDGVASTAIAAVSVVGWLGAFAGPVVAGALIEATGRYVAVFALSVALAVGGTAVAALVADPRAHAR
ncbi:MAG: nitrate/nitrite transporter [Haloarculaceae archaeon]